ncbi:MAG: hypothetical protein QM664_01955 [Flavihumibacter sp.]
MKSKNICRGRGKAGLVCLLLFSCLATIAQQQPALIFHAQVIDPLAGTIKENQSILVQNGRIVATGPDTQFKKRNNYALIDAKGLFVLPGFWDMHMHFGGGDTLTEENKWLLPLYLVHGITTIRDCAADISLDVLQWRDQINAGQLEGPRIFTSGPNRRTQLHLERRPGSR